MAVMRPTGKSVWPRSDRPSPPKGSRRERAILAVSRGLPTRQTGLTRPARPAREWINPFTKDKQKFAAKPASKGVRARSVKAIKDAVI